jgi:hypothetical protein
MSEKLTLTAKEVEWTNPLTGDGEYCTVEFTYDAEDEEVELKSVTWNRTGEDCVLRYISSEVREELIGEIEEQINDGDFPEIPTDDED